MLPPDDLMMRFFLPAMRQLVTLKLRARGLSQNTISMLLGITQASVSTYLSSDKKRAYETLSRLSVGAPDADTYAEQLAAAVAKNAPQGVSALNSIWANVIGSGGACQLHREMYPSLSDCDFCITEYGTRSSRQMAISEVAEAVRLIEGSPTFVKVMPEVSVNIACATEGAKSAADVVAVPGRIVKVRDRARALLPPEAGASDHMARVLLLVMSKVPEYRACINLRYDPKMSRSVTKEGLRLLSLGGRSRSGSQDPTYEALSAALKDSQGRFDAIVDLGGGGIEPNLYLFGKGAKAVASHAIRLARFYSAA